MPELHPKILFFTCLGLAACEAASALAGRDTLHHRLLTLRTWAGLFAVLFIAFAAGRPPLYGPFECAVCLCFYMGVLAKLFMKTANLPTIFGPAASLAVLVLLLTQAGRSMALNPDYYMYENPLVMVFFHSRILACAFLVHGASQYLAGAFSKTGPDCFFQGARNSLLAGACVFLAGEWAGSLWALNWLGDPWQWSRGFFKAAVLFLMVMAACHLPPALARNRLGRALAGALPGVFMVWVLFFY